MQANLVVMPAMTLASTSISVLTEAPDIPFYKAKKIYIYKKKIK
jgi:hypothetical protein